MVHELAQDAAEVTWSDDQQVIKALPTNGTYPALRVRVGVRGPHRRAQEVGADRAPHIVQGPHELGVAVTDQVTHDAFPFVERRGEVASLLGDPRAGRVGRDAGQMDPSVSTSMKNRT